MKKILKRILCFILVLTMLAGDIPATAYAAESGETSKSNPEKLVLEDEYISVTVSGKNGGFLIDTLKGDKLNKADDNKYLLYPATDYDTSYTSFRVTRENGKVEEYIFGREYGFLGWDSSDVKLEKLGTSIVATWSVKDLTIKQTLSIMDVMAAQHGMVSIGYSVTSSKDDVENVKVRIMMDTALGYQDYAVYQLPNEAGDFVTYQGETMLYQNGTTPIYDQTFFANNDLMTPNVTAYTINTTIDGKEMQPYQMAIGHWNNLASTVFDFVPDKTLNFTSAYNAKYMTADSAMALYFDMGALEKDVAGAVGTNYGIFSNVSVTEDERMAINFPGMPSDMELTEKDGEPVYKSQVSNKNTKGNYGDIELQMFLENLTDETLDEVTLLVKTQGDITTYSSWLDNVLYEPGEDNVMGYYTHTVKEVLPGEEISESIYFNVKPNQVSEYRRFQIEAYAVGEGETLTSDKLLGSREFYLFCPGPLGEEVMFNTINPNVMFNEGTRYLFLSGSNFRLLENTEQYTTILRPTAGGDDVVIPANKVIVDVGTDTMKIIVEEKMVPGSYQVVFDWVSPGKEDTTSDLLQFNVSNEVRYYTPLCGIITVEREVLPDGKFSETKYTVKGYETEEDYKEKVADPDDQVLLEFRGDFAAKYDPMGRYTEATATSVKYVDGTCSGTISISDCLDVEAGSVTINVLNSGEDNQEINIDIDGKVYTTNDRIQIWDGVCALTTIKNGVKHKLVQYNYDGSKATNIENNLTDTTLISLLWPSVAGVGQKLAGCIFKMRYAEFGQIAMENASNNTHDLPKKRVISFGAELDASFLVPSDFGFTDPQVGFFDKVQMTFARKKYTADQLRTLENNFFEDKVNQMAARGGQASIYVEDILFGGGFIGFNTQVGVGVPSYTAGMPELNGQLHLKIMPAQDLWSVGVKGKADAFILRLEAELVVKSYNNIPVPDKMTFFIGGITPGLNVDGLGFFWINGVGGGFENLYETVFCTDKIPPLRLILMGQMSLYNTLPARGELGVGLGGFDIALTEVALEVLAKRITIMKYAGLSLDWSPKIAGRAAIDLNIFGLLIGNGYVAVEEDVELDKIFFEGYANVQVNTPSYGIIPSITLFNILMGVNNNAIWGKVKVIAVDVGVTYYWGGDVDFAFGKFTEPTHILPAALFSVPVYEDMETGQVLYMSYGTNAVLAAEAMVMPLDGGIAGGVGSTISEPSVLSTVDRLAHTISLGAYNPTADMLLVAEFDAETKEEALRIVMGDKITGKPGVKIVSAESPNQEYELRWLDTSKDVNAGANQNANAIFGYDEETKKATVTVSFTEEAAYANNWKMTAEAQGLVSLYEMNDMAELDELTYTFDAGKNEMTAEWHGELLEDVEQLTVYAIDENDVQYVLYDTENYGVIIGGGYGGEDTFKLPADLPSGEYTLRVIGSNQEKGIHTSVDADDPFNYTNPNQPEAPVITDTKLGGDYSVDVDVTNNGYDGYSVQMYEQKAGEWVACDFPAQMFEAEEDGSLPATLTVGGSYEVPYYYEEGEEGEEDKILSPQEAENNPNAIAATKIVGLKEGVTYRAGVQAYKYDEEGRIFYSEVAMSDDVLMKKPVKANVTVSIDGADKLDNFAGQAGTIDVINTTTKVQVKITSDMPVSGTWTLDTTTASGTWNAANSTTITLNPEGGLTEGEHLLKLMGTNANGDYVEVFYQFRVDATGPRLQLTGPANGSFFKEKTFVTGYAEPDAVVHVLLEGEEVVTKTVDESGTFVIEVSMDTTKVEQNISVYATDEMMNKTAQLDFTLLNDIFGETEGSFAIYLDGEDVTDTAIPAGEGGLLSLKYVTEDRVLTIPEDSFIGRQAEWSVETVQGTAAINNNVLSSTSNVNGILKMTYDKQVILAKLGDNSKAINQTFDITLPESPNGYSVETENATTVNYGESFSFSVEIAEGYTATEDFIVKANGKTLEAVSGVYTIENIHAPKEITVEGVVDITVPTAEVKISENVWKEFLQNISFGLFFKESQDVTITTSDKGSGVSDIYYYVSDSVKTEDELETLNAEDWIEYNGTFAIAPNTEAVVYVKVTDNAGNETLISSDGLVLKNTAPVISGIENGTDYYGDVTFTVTDKYLDIVKVDGQAVTLEDGEYTITADNANHVIEATDKAGNKAFYTIGVYKIYNVEFVVDNAVMTTISVNHGFDLPESEFPAIPEKLGYNQTAPSWNSTGLTNVTEDKVVTAVYVPNKYTVTLPDNPEGYTIGTEQSTTVEHNMPFSFTVTVKDGYTKTDAYKVCVNGTAVQPVDGVYTIANVQSDMTITVEGVKDVTPPMVEVKVDNNIWKEFLNAITFGKFFKETQDVEITAEDNGNDVEKVYYYISDEALTLDEVKALSDNDWTEYANKFSIAPNAKYVVYVKAVDKSGNEAYISSDGMIIKNTTPVISGITDGEVYYGATEFTVNDEYLDIVTVDGQEVSLVNGSYTIPADNGQHVVKAIDKAGNAVTYTVTVYKIYNVEFIVDDVVIATIPVNHGANLPESEFPEIPAKDGYNQTAPYWKPAKLESVTEDKSVIAVYVPNKYTVTLPENPEGYVVETEQSTTVEYNKPFSFTVTAKDGYTKTDAYKVFVNGIEVQPTEDVYKISNVKSNISITVEGVKDITAPTVEVKVATNSWKEFLNTITFGTFFKETQNVQITVNDNGSGAGKAYYYISDEALTLDEVKALSDTDWKEYNGNVSISPNSKRIVYVKALDKVGNVNYISSDGMVFENTAPVISGITNGEVYYGTTTFTVNDEYLDIVTVDGQEVSSVDGSYEIPADNGQHVVKVMDKAGNEVIYTVTVYKIYNVKFVADGEVVATIPVKHGFDLAEDKFPEIPVKDGYTQNAPYWSLTKLENVTEDKEVVAVYVPNKYTIALPENPEGYVVETEQSTTVEYNKPFSFSVTENEGYTKTETYKVYVNGIEVQPVEGVYTIANVQSNVTITVEGVKDITPPTVEIKVSTNSWKDFLNTITFGTFFKDIQDVEIKVSDSGSGVEKVYYYISDVALTLEEVQALSDTDWTEYEEIISIGPKARRMVYATDTKCILYIKAMDKAGNVAYISSDGMLFENNVPVISGITNGEVYYGTVTFTVNDEYLDIVRVDGQEVTAVDGSYEILADNAQHVVEAVDKSGNKVTYTISVYKVYTITLPENPEGYVVETEQSTTVEYNKPFSFSVTENEGYTKTDAYKVYVNGIEVQSVDGVYTIEHVQNDVEITVEGVEEIPKEPGDIDTGDHNPVVLYVILLMAGLALVIIAFKRKYRTI